MKKTIPTLIIVNLLFMTFFINNVRGGISTTLIKDFNSKINVIYSDSSIMIIGTSNGLYYSTDGGKSFIQKNDGFLFSYSISEIEFVNNKFYIGTDGGGLYSGTIKDKSWNSEKAKVDCPTISQVFSEGNNIYVASHCTGFFASFDGGNNFTVLNKGLTSVETTAFLKAASDRYYLGTKDGLYTTSSINVSTVWKKVLSNYNVTSLGYINRNVVVGTNIGLFVGKDTNFNKIEIIGGSPYINSIEFTSDRLILSINEFGIFVTTDGLDFYRIKSEELNNTSALRISPEEKLFYAGDSNGKLYKIDLSKPVILFNDRISLGNIQKGTNFQGVFKVLNFAYNSFSGSVSSPNFITFSPKNFTSTTTFTYAINTSGLSLQNYSIPIKMQINNQDEVFYILFNITETSNTTIKLWVGSTTAYVNGKTYTLDATPFIDINSSRTLVPIRFISEAFNSEVQWDGTIKKVTIINKNLNKTIELWIGKKSAIVNGKTYELDVAPIIITPGRTFVPIRFVSEAFGAQVQWEGTKKEITIII